MLNNIDIAAEKGICWSCAVLPPRRCCYRLYSSLPQDGARAKSDAPDNTFADRSARILNTGDHGYGERDLKTNPAMCRKIISFAPQITPFVSLIAQTKHGDLATELDLLPNRCPFQNLAY